MPPGQQGQNIIEVGFSIDKLSQEKQQVLSIVADLFKKLEEYDGAKFDPLKGGGLVNFRQAIQDTTQKMGEYQQLAQKYNQTVTEQATKAREAAAAQADYGSAVRESANKLGAVKTEIEALTATQKQLKKDFDEGKISADQYGKALGELALKQAALKQQQADINKDLTNAAKADFATPNSVAGARSQNAILTKQRDATDIKDLETINQLNELINRNNKLIDENSDKLARQKINIGNYAGSFQEAFQVLKQQLESTKNEVAAFETKANNLTGRNPVGFDRDRFKGDVTNFLNTGQGGASVGLSQAEAASYQTATNKLQLLENVTGRVSVGFKTSRQEARAFQEAAVQLGLAVGQDSDEFLVFNKAVGHAQNGINDLKAATKFQSSDAKVITGLANAASTLAGAFGAAQAATSLFAGDNADLQKQMAQFQQLLVLINGLQAVANGLQAESGGIQLLLSARTNLLNAAKGVQALLFTRATQAIVANTAATEVNAEMKEVDAVATEVQTAETVKNTEATIVNKAAQEGAAGGIKKLTTGLIAGGIAAILVGIGVGLGYLTAKLLGFADTAGLTVDQMKDIADASKAVAEALDNQQKVYDALDDSQHRYYTNLIADAQAAGASQYALLLAQERFDKAQADAAKAEVDRLGATDASYSKKAQEVQTLLSLQQSANEEIKRLSSIPDKDLGLVQRFKNSQALGTNKELRDVYTSQLAAAQATLDKMTEARNKAKDFAQKASEDETRFNKLSLDDQLDVFEKAEHRRAELIKGRNAVVLASETSTLKDRLNAISSNLEAENVIINASIAKIQNNPANKLNGVLLPQAQAQVDQLDNQRTLNGIRANEEILRQNREFYKKNRDARLEAFKIEQQDQIRAAQLIQQGKIANTNALQPAPKVTISDQLTALAAEYQARRNILNAQRERDLDDININGKESLDLLHDRQAEIEKINVSYQSELTKLGQDFNQTRLDLEAKALDQSKKEWEKYYQERKNEISNNEADELALLNELSEKKLITDRRYARERQRIEDDAALARAQAAVRDAEVQRNSTKAGTEERAKAEEVLAARRKELSDRVKTNDDDTDKSRVTATLNTLGDIQTAYQNASGALSDLLDIGYKNQKVRLEEAEHNQEKAFEQQQNRISTSTANEQSKAAQLKILDDNRQAQKEINDRKSRQIDNEKARFDKAASLANIALSTSQAVVKFLADPGGFAGVALSISAGVIGLAELAEAAAVQIPHYRMGAGIPGRPAHAGGPAVVGDNWQKELLLEPGKSPVWSPAQPTLMDLKPFTQVIPLDMVTQMMMEGRFNNYGGVFAAGADDHTAQRVDRLYDAIVWQTTVMKESMKGIRPHVTVINNIDKDMAHAAWVRKNVFE